MSSTETSSPIQLRDYQTGAIQAIAGRFRAGVRRPMVVLPTGSGKTVVFSSIASGAVKKGNRVLILAHRDELIEQARTKLCTVDPALCMECGTVKAQQNDYRSSVVIASVQTLSRASRLEEVAAFAQQHPFSIVIVDEAHHSAADSYQRILRALGCLDDAGALTIGVTATPQRADSKNLGSTWQEIVYHRDMLSMIQEGYLVDLRGMQVRLEGFNSSDLRTVRGDYVDSEVEEMLLDAKAPEHVVAGWQEHAAGRSTIVFTPTVRVADEMADAFRDAGVAAEMVSGETPTDERRAILRRFSTGETTVICNCAVLTEGFDEPRASCIVIARPTRSQPLYVQMIGRGTRLFPGKADCLVLDTVGASDDLSLTTLPRLFGLADATEEERQQIEDEGVAVVATGRQQAEEQNGKRISRQVELFNRQDIAWVQAGVGLWTLNVGDESVMLEADGDTWAVRVYRRGQKGVRKATVTELVTGLDLGYAMGTAEGYARRSRSFSEQLMDRNAGWRSAPASPPQLETLRKAKVQVWNGMTKGEASDAISALMAQRRRSRASR